MKKLTAGIFATLLAVVSVGAAHAEIASKGYVDQQVGTKADASTVTALQGTVTTLGNEAEKIANRVSTVSETSSDTTYPSAKAVWDVVKAKTTGIASNEALTALDGRVTTAEGEIDTLQADVSGLETGKADKATTLTGYGITDAYTKGEVDTALAGKQATLTTAQQNAVNSGITAEKVGTYDGYAAQIATKANTDDLGALATKDTVSAAEIDANAITTAKIVDANVTKAKLASDVQASLGKADTALQSADLDGYATSEDLTSGLDTKQNTLTTEQLDAVNSGITTEKVATYDGYATQIAAKANTADLGVLATKDTVSAAEIDANAITTAKIVDANVTKAKLASDVQASLGKADTALQSADLDGYATSEEVAATYETKTNAQATYETKTNAQATYETKTNAANTYIPKVNAEGSDGKYVLTATAANGVATYKWELIERGSAE